MTQTKYKIVDVANPKTTSPSCMISFTFCNVRVIFLWTYNFGVAMSMPMLRMVLTSWHDRLEKRAKVSPKFSIPQSLIVNSESASEVPKYHNFDTPCSEYFTCNSCFKFQFSFVKSCKITKFLILKPCKQSFFHGSTMLNS